MRKYLKILIDIILSFLIGSATLLLLLMLSILIILGITKFVDILPITISSILAYSLLTLVALIFIVSLTAMGYDILQKIKKFLLTLRK